MCEWQKKGGGARERDEKKEMLREETKGAVSTCERGGWEKEGGRGEPSKNKFSCPCWLLIVQSIWCLRDLAREWFVCVFSQSERQKRMHLVFARFGSRMVHVSVYSPSERQKRIHLRALIKREREKDKSFTYIRYIYIYIYIYLYMCIFAHSHGAQPAHKALVEASTTMDVISVCASEDERELT